MGNLSISQCFWLHATETNSDFPRGCYRPTRADQQLRRLELRIGVSRSEKLGQASGIMVKVMTQKSLVKSHCTAILEIFIQDSQPEVRASNGVSLLPRLPRVG